MLLALSLLLLLWCGGYVWFMTSGIKVNADQIDTLEKTDVIVVVTGGTNRINTALSLLGEDLAEELFISGVGKNVSVEEILKIWGNTQTEPHCCITLGHEALNTNGNAREVRKWIDGRHATINTIRLVTSGYHMPRSLLEFRHALPDTTIIPHAVATDKDTLNKKDFLKISFSEYNKTLLTFINLLFDGDE